MPRDQRLVLLSLPTVAIVFGLLWLRHRRGRRRGTVLTDPGGDTSTLSGRPQCLLKGDGTENEFLNGLVHIQEEINCASESSEVVECQELVAESQLVDAEPPLSGKLDRELYSGSDSETECEVETTNTQPLSGPIPEPQCELELIGQQCEYTADQQCNPSNVELLRDQTLPSESTKLDPELYSGSDSGTSECELQSPGNRSELITELKLPGTSTFEEKCEQSLILQTLAESVSIPGPESTSISDSGVIVSVGTPSEVETEIVSIAAVEVKETPLSSVQKLTGKRQKAKKMKKSEQGELVDKLSSLELSTMKIGEKESQGPERDSANHSPSEVMLASPSMSNFSDAHSEGSSDSGKGHSDVATSPSRTPAGGGSLAGDVAMSLYEFVLPQVIVGRLIGRHGSFLHEIRTTTSANIFIKRHPDTSKLKICAIEGTQQDIGKALAKIRQKFPIRRFPQLTLEKVSFVTVADVPPLKLEDFHLQLVEGVNNDVILSSLISAAHFFVQQPSHPSYGSLSKLNQAMNVVYSMAEAPVLDPPVKDAVCAAPTMGGWYRAQIVDVDEESRTSTVRFLDYGGYLVVDSSSLKQIRGDLLTLPFQAVECYLANVAPSDPELGWSADARMFVQSMTQGQILQAQIYEYSEDGFPLVYLYTSFGNQVVLVNEELVARGYATLATNAQEQN